MERTVTEDRAKRQKPDDFFYVKSPKGGMQRNDGGYDASCEANDATDDPLPDAARPGGEGNVLRSIVLRQPAEAMHHLSRVRACVPDQ